MSIGFKRRMASQKTELLRTSQEADTAKPDPLNALSGEIEDQDFPVFYPVYP